MIGITQLTIFSTSRMLIEELIKSYRPDSIITSIEKNEHEFTLNFTTEINNEEKEGVFMGVVEKILHLKDPSDKVMETKVEARYLQQANKEYFFSKGELVRYRGFIDTDNPFPMITNLLISLHK
ncbi:MAG: hypothetical protein OEV44_13255 [Spirochaetota bacterium]|nr:hypothetical protein [Spirochaetota bacterium]